MEQSLSRNDLVLRGTKEADQICWMNDSLIWATFMSLALPSLKLNATIIGSDFIHVARTSILKSGSGFIHCRNHYWSFLQQKWASAMRNKNLYFTVNNRSRWCWHYLITIKKATKKQTNKKGCRVRTRVHSQILVTFSEKVNCQTETPLGEVPNTHD